MLGILPGLDFCSLGLASWHESTEKQYFNMLGILLGLDFGSGFLGLSIALNLICYMHQLKNNVSSCWNFHRIFAFERLEKIHLILNVDNFVWMMPLLL